MATREDLPGIQRLAVKVYYETFAASNSQENMQHYIASSLSLERFEQEFEESGSVFFVALEETMAGYAKLRTSDEVAHLLGTNSIELQRLYVDVAFQNRKVGAMLMKACLDYAVAKKFEWMWLGVWEKNFKAQQFYLKWGFEKFSEHIFQMGDDPQTDWLMKKPLM